MPRPITMGKIEEDYAVELINYINAKPDHQCGLCFYLNDEGLTDSYEMIEAARHLIPYGKGSRVVRETGQHPIRLRFAKDLLKLLETGRLWCNGKWWHTK